MKIQIPATLEGISTLKDGGLSIRLHTQELNPEERVTAMNYAGKFGWFLFDEKEHEDTELEDIRKDTGGKSPSQRLRSVLYVLYTQSKSDSATGSFDQFYAQKMEQLINGVKNKLD
jgi:hypothetical protein